MTSTVIDLNPVPTMNLYVIYDTVAESSGPVFESPNDASAIRKTVFLFIDGKQFDVVDYDLIRVGSIEKSGQNIISPDYKVLEWRSSYYRTVDKMKQEFVFSHTSKPHTDDPEPSEEQCEEHERLLKETFEPDKDSLIQETIKNKEAYL